MTWTTWLPKSFCECYSPTALTVAANVVVVVVAAAVAVYVDVWAAVVAASNTTDSAGYSNQIVGLGYEKDALSWLSTTDECLE